MNSRWIESAGILALVCVGVVPGCDDPAPESDSDPFAVPGKSDGPEASVDNELHAVMVRAAEFAGDPLNWDDSQGAEPEDREPDAPGPDEGGESTGGAGGDGGETGAGGAAQTCAGACGGEAPGGGCDCDDGCVENGDCCADFDVHCSDSGDTSAGAGQCFGACGGQSPDGQCYCDDDCLANGDCCDDYTLACTAGAEFESEQGFAVPSDPQASGQACWGVLELDVGEVAHWAGLGGLAAGTRCFAVAAVPAAAAAAPSGGGSVAAAAVGCGVSAAAGSAIGAAASVVRQTLPDLVQCSDHIVQSVIRHFPWGRGISTREVPVVEARQPSNCHPDRQAQLYEQVTRLCKGTRRKCVTADSCFVLGEKMRYASNCIAAREQINNECFAGGDDGHNKAIDQERELHWNCYDKSLNLGCAG